MARQSSDASYSFIFPESSLYSFLIVVYLFVLLFYILGTSPLWDYVYHEYLLSVACLFLSVNDIFWSVSVELSTVYLFPFLISAFCVAVKKIMCAQESLF